MKTNLIFLILMALTIVGCKDDDTFDPTPDQVVFDASAFVKVEDLAGYPLKGVLIKIGESEAMTDEDGVVYFKSVDMNPSTYLTAEKEGYFHGSRRFITSEGKTNFIKVVLLTEKLAGSIASNFGGLIQVGDGITLDFPANAIVNEDGQIYTGLVSVYAQPIMADDPNLSYKMPGDLVGLNEDGSQSSLASFGMTVVELRTAVGEMLQIKEGTSVKMKMEVPVSMLATAPTTIPMWYFDEEIGLWIEEGEAALVGNQYEVQLPHFSYWNCDASFEIVPWGARLVYEDGSAASQIVVCLTILSIQTTRCAVADADGFIFGEVAAGEELLMEVGSPCGEIIYSQQIGPYTDSTVIGPITIPTNNVSFTAIAGRAVNCQSSIVTNGFARIKVGTGDYFAELDDITGSFSVSVMNCDETEVTIKVVDEGALKESLPLTFPYAADIDAGKVTVCESLTEFIDLEVVGFPDHFIILFPIALIQEGTTSFVGQDSTSQFRIFYINVPGVKIGTYSEVESEINVALPNGDRAYTTGTDMTVNITYYGGSGDYIIGTISGTWQSGPNGQGGPEYPLVGTFSILRE